MGGRSNKSITRGEVGKGMARPGSTAFFFQKHLGTWGFPFRCIGFLWGARQRHSPSKTSRSKHKYKAVDLLVDFLAHDNNGAINTFADSICFADIYAWLLVVDVMHTRRDKIDHTSQITHHKHLRLACSSSAFHYIIDIRATLPRHQPKI